jgi:very-short-patch-repair endonuclease
VHGDLYDYSKVEYKNALTKVEIVCKTHGPFWQIPGSHTRRVGCYSCTGNVAIKGKAEREFIDKSNNVHGNRYVYNEVVYTNCKTKVVILCKHHGRFEQTPRCHLKGSGCPLCFGNRASNLAAKESFIKKSTIIHGNKYDYSTVEYTTRNTEVTIICPEHGVFWQLPCAHITNKAGCHRCGHFHKPYQEYVAKRLDGAKVVYETEKHYAIDKNHYFVDFYLPLLGLFVEVDELHHRYQIREDAIRQEKIERHTGLRFIRLDATSMPKLKKGVSDLLNNIL